MRVVADPMRIPEQTRAAILPLKDSGRTQLDVAIEFDVSDGSVWAIWNPERARQMRDRATARARERRAFDPEYASLVRQKWREQRKS